MELNKKKLRQIKILFIHNKCLWYRLPFFNRISKEHDIEFLFTDEKKVEGLEAKYEIIKRWGFPFISVAFGLIPRLIKKNYDIVIFPPLDSIGELIDNIFCYLIARFRAKPYILWNGKWKSKSQKESIWKKLFKTLIQKIFIKHLYNNSASIMVYGSKAEEYVKSICGRALFQKIFKIYNTMIDVGKIEEKSCDRSKTFYKIRRNLGIKKENKIVLYVGRLIKRKGISYLIRAVYRILKERNDVILIIAGDEYFGRKKDYCGEELRALCKHLNIQDYVYFVGAVKPEDVKYYYLMSNVLVLPSVTMESNEPWGQVIGEAMAMGRPIVTTNAVGASYDLIKNGVNGFVVPEKNDWALYKAIKIILERPDLEKKMGLISKNIIQKKFTCFHALRRFQKMLKFVLKNRENFIF